MYNVCDFGAIGDGKALDTAALQSAIDAAVGDTVYFPKGTYLTGALYLKSDMTLELAPGAVVYASSDKQNYEKNGETQKGFIIIDHVKNVKIRGGRFTADGDKFFDFCHSLSEEYESALSAEAWFYTKAKPWRFNMIKITDSENVTVSDSTIDNYPLYSIMAVRSNNLLFSGLKISGATYGINTDGIHLSSCCDSHITACYMSCGDDCVAIDSDSCAPAKNITVSDCVMSSSVHAFRLFTGFCEDDDSHRSVSCVSITNCVIKNAAGIFDINARRGIISEISISNISATLSREGTAFLLSSIEGEIKNFSMCGMNINGNGCGMISASKPGEISRVIISDCNFEITPVPKHWFPDKMLNEGLGFPNHCHFKPVNFHFVRACCVKMSNVNVFWHDAQYSDTWSAQRRNAFLAAVADRPLSAIEPSEFPCVYSEDCENISFSNCVLPDYRKK